MDLDVSDPDAGCSLDDVVDTADAPVVLDHGSPGARRVRVNRRDYAPPMRMFLNTICRRLLV